MQKYDMIFDKLSGSRFIAEKANGEYYAAEEVDSVIASRNEQVSDYQEQNLAYQDEIAKLKDALRNIADKQSFHTVSEMREIALKALKL